MIVLTNVTKKFKDKTAVDNVSFYAQSGVITGLIGSNGSGKSTIMRMVSTLLSPTQGEITVNGISVTQHPQDARKQIAVLLGGDVSLYDRLTARENILYFAQLQGVNPSTAQERLATLAEALHMNEYLDRKVFGFSRGMRQKVAFARAIIHDPDILLLDEPSTGLDINAIKDVQDFILYCKSQGKTILLSTHNAHEMDRLCDHIVIIEEGCIMAQGDKNCLLKESGCASVADLFFRCKERGGHNA